MLALTGGTAGAILGGFAATGKSPRDWKGLAPAFAAMIGEFAGDGFRGPFAVADGRVIHNAGGCLWSLLDELDEARLDETLALNLNAVIWLAQAAAPHMRASSTFGVSAKSATRSAPI